MKEHKYLNNNNPRKKTVRKFRFIGTLSNYNNTHSLKTILKQASLEDLFSLMLKNNFQFVPVLKRIYQMISHVVHKTWKPNSQSVDQIVHTFSQKILQF